MENRFWRVKMKYSYNDIFFDFDNADEATKFVVTAMTAFNKKESDDRKELYVSLCYIKNEDETEDED